MPVPSLSSTPVIVVVGSLHFDILVESARLPRVGETLPGASWLTKCGGKGANQAIEAARHGARTAMVGCVGDDPFGAQMRANLERAGVGVDHLAAVPQASGMSVALCDPTGDYGAIIVSGSNEALDVARIDAASGLIAPGGIVVLQNEIPDDANLAAAAVAQARGARVILNAAPARPMPEALAPLIDILVVNAVEADMLGAGVVDNLGDATVAARHLARAFPAVIVTAGGEGAAIQSESWSGVLPAHRVALVSTHGAGDAFIGALAARLAAGSTLRDAARYANAAAALLVSTAEDKRVALTRADTERLLASAVDL